MVCQKKLQIRLPNLNMKHKIYSSDYSLRLTKVNNEAGRLSDIITAPHCERVMSESDCTGIYGGS